MNFYKKSIFLLAIVTMCSCVTTKFGINNDDLIMPSNSKSDSLKEIEIPYNSFIHGIPVKGTKAGILGAVVSPDSSTLYIVINFPKFAILSTKDNGLTYNSSIFETSYFETEKEDDENRGYTNKSRKDIRVKSAFNGDFISISVGPFLFISKDNGITFKKHKLFYDLDRSFIRELFFDKNNRLYVFTDNKIAFTDDFGKKWTRVTPKTETLKNRNIQYIDSEIFNDIIYISYLDKNYFNTSLNKNNQYFKSGVYTLKSDKIEKTKINLPMGLIKDNNKLYGFDIFKTKLDIINFSEGFKKTSFYKTLNMAGNKNAVEYFIETLNNEYFKLDNYSQYQRIYDISTDVVEAMSTTPLLLNKTLNKTKNINTILRSNYFNYSNNNFSYKFDVENLFYEMSDGIISSLYSRLNDKSGVLYEIQPDKDFISNFIKNIITKKYEYDNTAPILRRAFNPYDFDSGNTLPFQFSISEKDVSMKISTTLLNEAINPELKTRSSYWYKNIDRKKNFRLEFVIGNDEKSDLLYYPSNLLWYNSGIIIEITYFNELKIYKELYKIPVLTEN